MGITVCYAMSEAVVASFCEVFQKSYGFIRKLVTAALASWKTEIIMISLRNIGRSNYLGYWVLVKGVGNSFCVKLDL